MPIVGIFFSYLINIMLFYFFLFTATRTEKILFADCKNSSKLQTSSFMRILHENTKKLMTLITLIINDFNNKYAISIVYRVQ